LIGLLVSLERDGSVWGGFAAKALPIASWKITAETSPARIVRMTVNANCLAVITSSCVEALDPTRGA
jgi:hypothetical protein